MKAGLCGTRYGNGNTDDKQIFLQEILDGRLTEKPTRGRRQIQLLSNLDGKKNHRFISWQPKTKSYQVTDSIYQDTVIQLVLPSHLIRWITVILFSIDCHGWLSFPLHSTTCMSPCDHVSTVFQRYTDFLFIIGSSIGAGTIFWLGEQILVKNNQDNQIQSITFCNMYFSKRYTQCTIGSGAAPEAEEFSRIFVLKVTLQFVRLLTNCIYKKMGKQDVVGGCSPCSPGSRAYGIWFKTELLIIYNNSTLNSSLLKNGSRMAKRDTVNKNK